MKELVIELRNENEQHGSSRWQMVFKIVALKNVTISTGNTCVGVSFIVSYRPEGLIEKRLQRRYFSRKIAKFKNY